MQEYSMFDPCKKERNEYTLALHEEQLAKEKVDFPSKPLGKGTPRPTNLNAMKIWLEKEEITKQKYQALIDCEKVHKNK